MSFKLFRCSRAYKLNTKFKHHNESNTFRCSTNSSVSYPMSSKPHSTQSIYSTLSSSVIHSSLNRSMCSKAYKFNTNSNIIISFNYSSSPKPTSQHWISNIIMSLTFFRCFRAYKLNTNIIMSPKLLMCSRAYMLNTKFNKES